MDAFKEACTERHLPGWVEKEQVAMAIAANQWAEAHGLERRVTRDDVIRIEQPALGHIDYQSKLCLYLVEWLYDGGSSW
jgi:hypothetical protein